MQQIKKAAGQLFAVLICLCVLTGCRMETAAPVSEQQEKSTGEFELHMLDVDQGMSVLIKADGHYLLYDGGDAATSSFVVSYLEQQGVRKLDYIVASHYDADHISGLVGALHVFDCDVVLAPDYEADTKIYQSYLSAVENNGAQIIYPVQGDTYTLGEAEIKIVGPYTYTYTGENDRCVSIQISYGNTKYLICGDAEAQAESDMVNSGAELRANLYVVNHHGSASSSSFYFMNQVRPDYALISCSGDNSYGHPAQETLERLQQMDCDIFRTDKQGTIIAYSDGGSIWFNQEAFQDQPTGVKNAPSGFIQYDDMQESEYAYVCNVNSNKFHHSYCDSVNKMSEKNKKYTNESRDELIQQGYDPCQNCNP